MIKIVDIDIDEDIVVCWLGNVNKKMESIGISIDGEEYIETCWKFAFELRDIEIIKFNELEYIGEAEVSCHQNILNLFERRLLKREVIKWAKKNLY